MKLNKLLLVVIISFLGNSLYAQVGNKAIIDNINDFLQTVYQGYYKVNTLIDLDADLGDMRVHDLPTEDPYGTIKNSYFFVAEAHGSPEDLGNIVGIYKDGNVLWYSGENEVGIAQGYNLFTTRDINNDGKVEILITGDYGAELWIYSWDGTTGERINDKDYWTSVIQGPPGSFTLFDAEGDGILEIRSLAERDGSETWSWNGQLYGKWSNTPIMPDISWFPRDNVIVDVDCKIIKQNNLFSYNYTVRNDPESKQRINRFTVESKTDTITKTQPEGWVDRVHWVWDQEGWGTEVFYWNKPKEILPGQSLDSFKIESPNLPFIALYVVRGENMLPLTTEYTSAEDSADFVNNSVKGYTIGPSVLPYPFIQSDFLDTLLNYNTRSLELGWITNQTTADKYDSLFTLAKTQLQQNNNNAAKTTLQTVLQEVNVDSTNNLTSEAYALLRYNTEYLITQIPEGAPGLPVKLINSQGSLLPGGSLKYYDAGWKDAIDNGDGTFTVQTERTTVSLKMTYEYGTQQKDNVTVGSDTVVFQTVNAAVQLKNSQGELIDTGTVQYYAGAWREFGTTINGVATK